MGCYANRRTFAINSVDGFNPADYAREIINDDGSVSQYLDVKYRLLWFRLHRPNGKIETEVLHADERSAVVSCRLYADRCDHENQYIASSTAQRFASESKYGDRFLEIAETAAIGRVLAAAGYGTQFCGSSDMSGEVIADEPVREERDSMNEGKKTAEVKTVAGKAGPKANYSGIETDQLTMDELPAAMTVEEAGKTVVDVGMYKGITLAEIAAKKRSDLDWFLKYYAGKNTRLKEAVKVLIDSELIKES